MLSNCYGYTIRHLLLKPILGNFGSNDRVHYPNSLLLGYMKLRGVNGHKAVSNELIVCF